MVAAAPRRSIALSDKPLTASSLTALDHAGPSRNAEVMVRGTIVEMAERCNNNCKVFIACGKSNDVLMIVYVLDSEILPWQVLSPAKAVIQERPWSGLNMTHFPNVRGQETMISQTNQDAGGNAELRNFASAANQVASDEPTEIVADHARLSQASMKPVPTTRRIADARALEAHVERRQRLAAQVKVENPSRTEEEIEARLEQFGV